ncbi:MAG: RsbRD N-terminal domain-containing protein [Spirochaetia bacterium]|nr:RsbRD N-terminal domain-containing protein [Spirochaetia bacterium]
MGLYELLKKNKEKIAGTWKEKVLQIKLNGQVIASGNTGQFTNPVHFTIANSLDTILDSLLQDKEIPDQVLDDILRIRAVQTMPPSQAVSFLFILKELVRETAKNETFFKDLFGFELKLDKLLARSFDIYMACREQIFNLKLTENQKGVFADVEMGAGCPSALLDQMEMEKNKNKSNQSGGSQ